MPRADGSLAGYGWSQKRSDAWTRIFTSRPPAAFPCSGCSGETYRMDSWNTLRLCSPCDMVQPVPRQAAREVPRLEDELADDQAARDGYSPH